MLFLLIPQRNVREAEENVQRFLCRQDSTVTAVSKTGNAPVATSLTKGNAFARFDTLINSLTDTTAEKLKEDGLLR